MSTEPNVTLLINPNRYPQYIKKLKKLLKKGIEAKIIESKSAEDFQNQVHQFLASNQQYLLVWGGDGTAHLAINAWMFGRKADPQKAMGFLRGGSGNGIQDSYEVPFSLSRQVSTYLQSMKKHYVQRVDLLKTKVSDQIQYAQLIGMGFDAQVLQRRFQYGSSKSTVLRVPGFLRYINAGLQAFFRDFNSMEQTYRLKMKHGKYALRSTRANAELPFQSLSIEPSPTMMEIGTRPFYGRMFKICPDVVCNDGLMDLYLFKFQKRYQLLLHLFSLWNGWHHRINKNLAEKGRPLIERYEIQELKVSAEKSFYYHIDGEVQLSPEIGSGIFGIKIGIEQQAIPFLVPETFHRKFQPESLNTLRKSVPLDLFGV